MAPHAARVHVADTPTPLNAVDASGVSGSGLILKNLGEATVYVGGADVDVDEGYPVEVSGELAMDFESSNELLYGIVDTGTVEVAVLRVGA